MDAAFGLTSHGEQITDPHPLIILCILIPIAILVLLFLKNTKDKVSSLAISIATGLDIALWALLASGVKRAAEDNYCTSKTTGWFWVNCFVMIAMLGFGMMVYRKVLFYDGNLLSAEQEKAAKQGFENASRNISSSVTKLASDISKATKDDTLKVENPIGFCNKCGTPIPENSKFCVKCGAVVNTEDVKPIKTEEKKDAPIFTEPETAVSPEPASETEEKEKEE